MNIILNHTLRSVKSNRAQIALIITTIALVTVMIFVALSITGLFYNINISSRSRLAENTDIGLTGELFSVSRVNDFIKENKDKIEFADYYLELPALVKTDTSTKIVMLEATDFRKLYQRYSYKLKTRDIAKNNFEYPAIWIGEDFAEELGVKVGETLDIYYQTSNTTEKFSISRIMKNQGFFADSTVNNIMVDINSINSRGMSNTAYLKLKRGADFDETVQILKTHMKNDAIEIESAIDYERVNQIVKNNTRLLNIALAFIMTIMGLILFTSYLVIAKNRLNEMIIFKAAGATPLQTTFIMLTEVALYGIVGATVGLILGRVGMGAITKALLPNFPDAITYNLWKYAAAFLTGIVVSVVSALLPIMRVSKKSIREMSSGIVKDVKYIKPIFIIIITILLGASLTLLLLNDSLIVPLTIVLIVLFAFWIYFVVPYIIKWISLLFSKLSGQSRLAAISIKRNASTNTLTILVSSVITFSFIVVSVISLIITAITPYNTRFSADLVINSTEKMQYDEITNNLIGLDGIEDIVYYRTAEFELQRENAQPLKYHLVGINNANALKYSATQITKQDIQKFNNTSHPAVINNDMANRMGLEIGDKFTVSRINSTASETYNETLDYEFTVTAIDYSANEYDRIIYIKIEDMLYNGNSVEFTDEKMFIKSMNNADKQDLFLSVRDKLSDSQHLFVLKFEDWVFATAKGLTGVSILLRFIQILVSFVAFVGVINLSIVTFNDRKNEMNIYKTSGMSAKKYSLLALFEGMIIGIAGGIIGIILSFFFNSLMPSFAGLIEKFLVFSMFPLNIPIIALIAIFVYVFIYSMIALSNKKAYLKYYLYNQRNL